MTIHLWRNFSNFDCNALPISQSIYVPLYTLIGNLCTPYAPCRKRRCLRHANKPDSTNLPITYSTYPTTLRPALKYIQGSILDLKNIHSLLGPPISRDPDERQGPWQISPPRPSWAQNSQSLQDQSDQRRNGQKHRRDRGSLNTQFTPKNPRLYYPETLTAATMVTNLQITDQPLLPHPRYGHCRTAHRAQRRLREIGRL